MMLWQADRLSIFWRTRGNDMLDYPGKMTLQAEIKLPIIVCKYCGKGFSLVEFQGSAFEQVEPTKTVIRKKVKFCPFCGSTWKEK